MVEELGGGPLCPSPCSDSSKMGEMARSSFRLVSRLCWRLVVGERNGSADVGVAGDLLPTGTRRKELRRTEGIRLSEMPRPSSALHDRLARSPTLHGSSDRSIGNGLLTVVASRPSALPDLLPCCGFVGAEIDRTGLGSALGSSRSFDVFSSGSLLYLSDLENIATQEAQA